MDESLPFDLIHYLDQHFANEDWLTQDVWFQVRKRLKDQENASDKDAFEKMIVITTMDSLPELCYECPCHDGENGQCNADKEKRYSAEYRPYWCPLKKVDLNNGLEE